MDRCKYDNCQEQAVSLSEFCYKHIKDKDGYRKDLAEYIRENNSIERFYLRNIEMPGFDFVDTNCRYADFTSCDLKSANFSGADMKHCNLTHANLKSAYLDNADLSEAHLLGCNLSGARLWHADLKGANLSEANLSCADLLNTDLSLVKFWNADITGAKLLTMQNFTYKKGKFLYRYGIDEKGPASAAEGYRNLKQYFISVGRYDDASWASFKEKQQQRRQLLREGNATAYGLSLLIALMCGYGEKPYRVILFSIAVTFIYAILYYATSALNIGGSAKFWDCLYFSMVTFTTLGFGDITPKLVPFFQMLIGTEAFTGAFMMGLFVFTLARKYSAR